LLKVSELELEPVKLHTEMQQRKLRLVREINKDSYTSGKAVNRGERERERERETERQRERLQVSI
jgi:hypothetical protein